MRSTEESQGRISVSRFAHVLRSVEVSYLSRVSVGRIWTPPSEGRALTRNPAVGSNELLREPQFARSGTVTGGGYLICLSTRLHCCRGLYLVGHYFGALRGYYGYLPMRFIIDSNSVNRIAQWYHTRHVSIASYLSVICKYW